MTEFDYNDLRPGDILLSEPEPAGSNLTIGNLIVRITGDPYSHAAIVHRNIQEVAEQGGPGKKVSLRNFLQSGGGTKWLVTRLEDTDLEPVLQATDDYLDQGDEYATFQLMYFSLLLLKKNWRLLKDPKVRKAIRNAIVQLLGPSLPGKSNVALAQDKKPKLKETSMFCSQFVYQMYAEPGKDYELKIKDHSLKNVADDEEGAAIDYIIGLIKDKKISEEDRPVYVVSNADEETLLADLCEALKGMKEEPGAMSPSDMSDVFDAEMAIMFSDFVVAFAKRSGDSSTISTMEALSKQEQLIFGLSYFKKANFVTPGDLSRISNSNAKIMGTFVTPSPESPESGNGFLQKLFLFIRTMLTF